MNHNSIDPNGQRKDEQIQMQRLYDRDMLHQVEEQVPQELDLYQEEIKEASNRRTLKQTFDELDQDNDGYLSIHDVKRLIRNNQCGQIPPNLAQHILRMHDEDSDGRLDFEEFYRMSVRQEWLFSRMMKKYCRLVVPPPRRSEDETDGAYERSMRVCPPPLTMIVFSMLEITMFLIDILYFKDDPYSYKGIGENTNGPAATLFIYNPYRRFEAWRFVTYMFVHVGVMHIMMNLVIQIFLGVALELVHHWWRVALVYLAGVAAGSMGTSIANPRIFLAGASGGVYALITAHIATIIMNWREMEFAIVQLFVFLIFCATDVGFSAYRHFNDVHDQVGYVAHLCGAVAGLLVGIGVLRNLKVRPWEKKLWWCAVTLYFLLMLSGISFHLFYKDHFPQPRPSKAFF